MCLLKFLRIAPDTFPHKLIGHELVNIMDSSPDLVDNMIYFFLELAQCLRHSIWWCVHICIYIYIYMYMYMIFDI